jgi:hypothetical protein
MNECLCTHISKSIVRVIDETDPVAVDFGIKTADRFLFMGAIAQDVTRCVVIGIHCGKNIPYLPADAFEEVGSDEI